MKELFEFLIGANPIHWLFTVLGLVGLLLMPFIQNEENSDDNTLLIFEFLSSLLVGLILMCAGYMFKSEPEMAGVFLKSFFIDLPDEEITKLRQLNISPSILITMTIFIAILSYSISRIIDLLISKYSCFLSRPTKERREYMSLRFSSSFPLREWKTFVMSLILFIGLSLLLKSCGIAVR